MGLIPLHTSRTYYFLDEAPPAANALNYEACLRQGMPLWLYLFYLKGIMVNIKKENVPATHLEIARKLMLLALRTFLNEPRYSAKELTLQKLGEVEGADYDEEDDMVSFYDGMYKVECTKDVLIVKVCNFAWGDLLASYLRFEFTSDGDFELDKVTPEAAAFMADGNPLEILERLVLPIIGISRATKTPPADLLTSEPKLLEVFELLLTTPFVSALIIRYFAAADVKRTKH